MQHFMEQLKKKEEKILFRNLKRVYKYWDKKKNPRFSFSIHCRYYYAFYYVWRNVEWWPCNTLLCSACAEGYETTWNLTPLTDVTHVVSFLFWSRLLWEIECCTTSEGAIYRPLALKFLCNIRLFAECFCCCCFWWCWYSC